MGQPKKLVTVHLPDVHLIWIEDQVRAGVYPSRSAAIRQAVRDLIQRKMVKGS